MLDGDDFTTLDASLLHAFPGFNVTPESYAIHQGIYGTGGVGMVRLLVDLRSNCGGNLFPSCPTAT